MSTLIEIVNSKYGDYKGNVSIDFQDQFFTRLKSLGFPKGVIVGTGFEFGEIKGECSLDRKFLCFNRKSGIWKYNARCYRQYSR